MSDLDKKVRSANKDFYDRVAESYDSVDGRRNAQLLDWLSSRLRSIAGITNGGVLLDLGCGSGVVIKEGARYFSRSLGMDVSPGILKAAAVKGLASESAKFFCAEGATIPLKDSSVDAIVCFAVLHHIYDPYLMIREAYRVLRKGGVFYSDHDMSANFMRRFYPLMFVYRRIFDASRRYKKAADGITDELYGLTEIHSNGIDTVGIMQGLKDAGFSDVDGKYHWYGLNGLTNRVFGKGDYAPGFAPLFSVVAKK